MKFRIALILFAVAGIVVIVIGALRFNEKVKTQTAGAQAYSEQYIEDLLAQEKAEEEKLKAEEEKAKKKREKEQKKAFEEHEGEELTYLPIGDSLAVGFASSSVSKRYVSLFEKNIEKTMGYDVYIDKEITKSGGGLKDGALAQLDTIEEVHPDLVTIEYGTNDKNQNMKDIYLTPQEFKDNLKKLVDYIYDVNEDTKIILVTPWKDTGIEYDSAIKTVGKEYSIPVVDITPIKNRQDIVDKKGTELASGAISDGWHPNDKGHKLIAEAIYEQAFDLLK